MKHTRLTYTLRGLRDRLTRLFLPACALLGALLAVSGMASCVAEHFDEEAPCFPEEETGREPDIYLTLNVGVIDGYGDEALGRETFATRATRADDSYYFEEKVRPNERLRTLDIFITDDNDVIEGLRSVEYSEAGVLQGSNLTFRLKPGKKRIYLLGNSASLPQSARDLFTSLKLEDTYPSAAMADVILSRSENVPFYTLDQLIPMVETFELTLENPIPGVPSYIYKDLFITRIAVKYTFITTEDLPAVKVRMSSMADRQYLVPRDLYYTPGKYQPPVTIDGIPGRNIYSFQSPLLPAQTKDFEVELTGREVIEITELSGKKVSGYRYDPIYLMESPATTYTINAGVASEDITGVPGDMEWLTAQTLPNLPLLPRNTHVVVRMGFRSQFSCQVDLVPYRGCILKPFFGLE